MSFSYENQGVNTYLVYKLEGNDAVDTLSLGMLTNNSIPSLAKTLFTQMDDEKYIKYNVSAKISMQQFFSGAVNRKRLLGVFGGIVDGLLSAEDYMIDTSSIILDPNYIFVDVSTCMSTLICLPIVNIATEKTNLGVFFKNIMVNTQFDQTENSDHVAKIFNFLNASPVFSLLDFKKLIDELRTETNNSSVQSTTSRVQTEPVKTKSAAQPVQPTIQQPTVEVTSPQPSTPVKPQPVIETAPTVKSSIPTPPVQSEPVMHTEPEKKMSMFGLLMHYSKENKALYEKQKAAKKAKPSTPQQNKQPATNSGFAVPGMNQTSGAPSFAIPGQPAPSVQQSIPVKPQVQPAVKQPTTAKQPIVSPQPIQNKPSTPVVPQGQPMNFGETTVLGSGSIGETTVLNGGMQQAQSITPRLIRSKNNEKILLNKPVFRIGKERSYVDYFIGDNTAISRSHANFITRDGEYFVVDTNSTNHTFVNGKMIQSNVETAISHGDTIRLANEDFEFKLY